MKISEVDGTRDPWTWRITHIFFFNTDGVPTVQAQGKPGESPCGSSVVAQFRSFNLQELTMVLGQLSYSLGFSRTSSASTFTSKAATSNASLCFLAANSDVDGYRVTCVGPK